MGVAAPVPSIAAMGGRAGARSAVHIDHAFRAILRGPDVVIGPRVVQLITRTPHPFGNFAMLARADDTQAARDAARTLVACGAPAAVLTTDEPTAALTAELNAAGFERHDGLPAMAVEIERLGPTRLPPGYTLARVEPNDREAWGEAFARGYELPGPVGAAFAAGVGQPHMHYYAILRDGRMVCTSLLFLHDGLAGIYGVATVPEERKKGLGAHVTAEPLREARAHGYRVGVLQASAAGHPVYKTLGFADFAEVALFVRIPV